MATASVGAVYSAKGATMTHLPAIPCVSILIRHQAFNADPHLFIGIETDLTYSQVQWALAYLLAEFERLPQLPGTPDALTPVELVELLWRCYGCRPVVRTRAIGFDHEIEIWRLQHDREMLDVEQGSEWTVTLSRPGARRAMLELMLDSVRSRLGLTVQQIDAELTNLEEEATQYRFLLRVLEGQDIDAGEGWLDSGGRT
ncbi:hypothetical protein Q0M94_24200 (plasmid) [Deinococcus radiomollis]|uniref:hypothetical protein n=1 Tax=Deinococcus radiomollis TaxID=468916 RepID=UPI0038921712